MNFTSKTPFCQVCLEYFLFELKSHLTEVSKGTYTQPYSFSKYLPVLCRCGTSIVFFLLLTKEQTKLAGASCPRAVRLIDGYFFFFLGVNMKINVIVANTTPHLAGKVSIKKKGYLASPS